MSLTTDINRRFRDMFDPLEDYLRLSPLAPTVTSTSQLLNPPSSSLFPSALSAAAAATFRPTARMDVCERGDSLIVSMELPGIRKEDIKINFDSNNRLYVQASKKEEVIEDNDRYYLNERNFGVIRRSLELPTNCNPDRIDANLRDGVLSITIAKRDRTEPSQARLIQVR